MVVHTRLLLATRPQKLLPYREILQQQYKRNRLLPRPPSHCIRRLDEKNLFHSPLHSHRSKHHAPHLLHQCLAPVSLPSMLEDFLQLTRLRDSSPSIMHTPHC